MLDYFKWQWKNDKIVTILQLTAFVLSICTILLILISVIFQIIFQGS